MASRIEDENIVVETSLDGVHRWRIRPLDDDEPGRPPTEEERAMPRTEGAPPPISWNLDASWQPRRRGGPQPT